MSKMKAAKIVGKGIGKMGAAGGLMAIAFWIGTANKTLFNNGKDDIKQGINLFKNSLDDEDLDEDEFNDEY